MMMTLHSPIVREHEGIQVVRDDLIEGGTKTRYLLGLYETHDHIVYASPAEGGAQSALAMAARLAGKRCTIFVAERKEAHPRALLAKSYGADVVQVAHGYLNVVQSKAAEFCRRTGAYNLPFGGATETAIAQIADAAVSTGLTPDEVWCAAGSGTLAQGLATAWPAAHLHLVPVGRTVDTSAIGFRYSIHTPKMRFSQRSRAPCPFPSDPHYDRKAWEMCKLLHDSRNKTVLFWNVTGEAGA